MTENRALMSESQAAIHLFAGPGTRHTTTAPSDGAPTSDGARPTGSERAWTLSSVRLYRTAVAGAATVAAVAGVVALVAAAVPVPPASPVAAEAFPDALVAGTSHVVAGPFLERYRREGGPSGRLGLPVGDDGPVTFEPARRAGADREVGFRHGVIYLDSRTGTTEVGIWYADRTLTRAPLRGPR